MQLSALAYGLSQAVRTAWFWGHYAVTQRLAPPMADQPPARLPSRAEVRSDLAALFRRDWENIRRGIYPPPADMVPSPLAAARQARRYFADLARVNARRREGRNSEVFRPPHRGRYPRYYLQNFHYQTDGYLSSASAELYDYQVEVLFSGGADAMRRQALVPLAEHVRRREARGARLLDVACGTGRFLTFVKDAHPRLTVTGVDLSPDYVAHARRALSAWTRARIAVANAEALPFAAASQDVVTCLYLFHELPHGVRRGVAAEIARVLRPDGVCVFVDSIRKGDHPPYDGLLDRFPHAVHEPYFADYASDDLEGLFAAAGLVTERCERAFLSRIMTLRRADAPPV